MRVREKERQNRQVYKEEKMNRFRNSIFFKMYRAAANFGPE